MRALFLISPTSNSSPDHGDEHNDNHLRLPKAFADAGWQVDCEPHEALSQHSEGARHPASLLISGIPISTYQLVWPVGFGPARSFLDRAQLLATLPTERIISAPEEQSRLHSKLPWLKSMPATLISMAATELVAFMHTHGGDWVLKPLAGSFGREVWKVTDPACIDAHVRGDQYWMLQRYISAISDGEVRTLVADGRVIGSYLRTPKGQDFRANLSQGSDTRMAKLTGDTAAMVEKIAAELHNQNIGFAAIDTCGGYLMEVNVANPGGLATLAEVYQQDFDQVVVSTIAQRFS